MANLQIPVGAYAVQGFTALPAGTSLGSLTASIDNYTAGYIAPAPGNPNVQAQLVVVPKAVPVGGVVTVTITINGTAVGGAALPTITEQFDLVGAPAPAVATAINASLATVVSGSQATNQPPPADPGSASITLI
jgi:hypothetical protein